MAVEDSFRTLDGVSSTIQAGTKYLLKTKRPSTIKSTGPIDPQSNHLYSNTKPIRKIGGEMNIPVMKRPEKKLVSTAKTVDISKSGSVFIGSDNDFTEDHTGNIFSLLL